MSGHSKWSSIKHKKAKTDAAKGKAFTKAGRLITSSVKTTGDPNPESNASLRLAIQKARDVNMPNDNIQRAIKRALDKDSETLEEITYEGYAPGGVALLIECMTDNKNRTLPVVRSTIEKHGGSMGSAGSVGYMFKRKGQIVFEKSKISEEQIMNIGIEAGAEDIKTDEGNIEVLTSPDNFEKVRSVFEEKNIEFESAAIQQLPDNYIPIADEKIANHIIKIIERLEDDDDIQNVYSNHDIEENLLDKLITQ
ncbi:YebC/PmpR family DNA-binding transcriptional regulator [Candidatus Margulisiibacteriota bacterium]